jgi:predicted YcjX-like family ATPase
MKIGITGIANGGKTVFLTSLLWHLSELNTELYPERFYLNHDIKLDKFQEVKDYKKKDDKKIEPFPFELYRDTLTEKKQWPKKTTDNYKYICEFDRVDWQGKMNRLKRLGKLKFLTRQRLEFFDFPGERIADSAIATYSDYEQWSKHILKYFSHHSYYRETFEEFEKCLKSLNESDNEDLLDKVVSKYKAGLASLFLGNKPFISPSTFVLDQNGSAAKIAPLDDLVKSRVIGFTEKKQFAPLSQDVCEKFPKLKKKMHSNYNKYRKEIVLPLFNELSRADRLVVLVDIPSLLSGGVGRYNDNRQVLLDLFEKLSPESKMFGRFQKLFGCWVGGLSKVAFVATKSDLVLNSDCCDGKLQHLLQTMTDKAKKMLSKDVESKLFECSAITSTLDGEQNTPDILVGYSENQTDTDDKKVQYDVSHLPDQWPKDWNPEEYDFPNVRPVVAKNKQFPPGQRGLDRILEFLIN